VTNHSLREESWRGSLDHIDPMDPIASSPFPWVEQDLVIRVSRDYFGKTYHQQESIRQEHHPCQQRWLSHRTLSSSIPLHRNLRLARDCTPSTCITCFAETCAQSVHLNLKSNFKIRFTIWENRILVSVRECFRNLLSAMRADAKRQRWLWHLSGSEFQHLLNIPLLKFGDN